MDRYERVRQLATMSRQFKRTYCCNSVLFFPNADRDDIEKGGKIIMPPSALDLLARLNVEYPMLFRLTNEKKHRSTHAGVLEFIASEGKIYIPHWMMQNLLLEEGAIVQIENVSLPVATYTKFKPQNVDFLGISNQKAVLENALRNFACLTTGDVIAIDYNSKIYELHVLITKPAQAVSIIECDMNVDFDVPVGYQQPVIPENVTHPLSVDEPEVEPIVYYDMNTFVAFSGKAMQLNGKGGILKNNEPERKILARGIPDYNHCYGLITFDRSIRPNQNKQNKPQKQQDEQAMAGKKTETKYFNGQGFSLKKNRP